MSDMIAMLSGLGKLDINELKRARGTTQAGSKTARLAIEQQIVQAKQQEMQQAAQASDEQLLAAIDQTGLWWKGPDAVMKVAIDRGLVPWYRRFEFIAGGGAVAVAAAIYFARRGLR